MSRRRFYSLLHRPLPTGKDGKGSILQVMPKWKAALLGACGAMCWWFVVREVPTWQQPVLVRAVVAFVLGALGSICIHPIIRAAFSAGTSSNPGESSRR